MPKVSSEQIPYVQIPHWILDASAPAVKLYVLLKRYSNNETGVAWPSRSTLAKDMGFKSVRSIDKFIDELEEMGAVVVVRERTAEGLNKPNQYRINMVQPNALVHEDALPSPEIPVVQTGALVQIYAGGSANSLQGVVHRIAPELRTKNYNQELEPIAACEDNDEADALFAVPAEFENSGKPKRRSPLRRIPDDFTLTLDRKRWAAENTPAVLADRETDAFVDYWRGEQGLKRDWDGTWRNWMRRKQTEMEKRGWVPAKAGYAASAQYGWAN